MHGASKGMSVLNWLKHIMVRGKDPKSQDSMQSRAGEARQGRGAPEGLFEGIETVQMAQHSHTPISNSRSEKDNEVLSTILACTPPPSHALFIAERACTPCFEPSLDAVEVEDMPARSPRNAQARVVRVTCTEWHGKGREA